MIRACSPACSSSPSLSLLLVTAGSAQATQAAGCVRASDRATNVSFQAAGGARLKGAVLGRGSTGVVLAHTTSADRCQWLPFARELAKQGYRALVFDMRGYGASTGVTNTDPHLDVIAAAAELRRRGAKKIVLAGASMGGTGVVSRCSRHPPCDQRRRRALGADRLQRRECARGREEAEASGSLRRRPRRRRLPCGYARSLQGGSDEGQEAPHRAVARGTASISSCYPAVKKLVLDFLERVG